MSAPKRIGINTVFLNPHRQGGAETYVRELIRELVEFPPEQLSEFKIILFVSAQSEFLNDVSLQTHLNFETVVCPVDSSRKNQRIWWEQTSFPKLIAAHRLDLMHFPYGTMSVRYKGNSVVTIHDTLRFCFPEQMPVSQKLYRAWNEHYTAKRCRGVIAVSQADASLITQHLRIPAENISVVYHGVHSHFFKQPAAGEPPLHSQGKLTHPKLLWIGRPYERKNVKVLIEACAHLSKNYGISPQLKLIGIEQADEPHLKELIQATETKEMVELVSPQPHLEIPKLLAECDLFLYPSLYESFGLPVLEAMAASTACICADIPPFRELYSEGVVYAEATSAEDYAQKIKQLCESPQTRTELTQRGFQQAQKYSWKTCVQQHLDVYRQFSHES